MTMIKITSSVAVDGRVIRPGETVDVPESDAKDLIRRGKAVLADNPVQEDEPVKAVKPPAPKAKNAPAVG